MSLGTLFVDLKANVADYISGMGKAAYASKQAGRDIRESFEGLGGILGSILGPLGEVGGVFAETFSKVGNFAGSAATSFGKLGGAMGLVGAGAGVAVGALAAVEVGTIGIALHAIETAAKLDDLSKATGVSTEALSGLGYAAKLTSVPQEALVTGLEKLNKAVFAAATAPTGATTAFSRLGISVKDASGTIKPTTELFEEISGKLEGVASPAARGALAMQLFGKAGAGLLPLLLEGKEGIAQFVAQAQKMGLIVDGETAAASEHFERTIDQLKGTAEGAALALGRELLPQLQAVATELTEGLSQKGSGISDLISGVKTLSQYFLSFGGLVALVFKDIGQAASAVLEDILIDFEEIKAEASALKSLFPFAGGSYWDQVTAAEKEANLKREGNEKNSIAERKKNWEDYKAFLVNAFKDSPDSVVHKPPKPTNVNLDPADADKNLNRIKEQLAALEQQTKAQLKLAAATVGSMASQRLLTAANEADAIILKLMSEADKTKGVEKSKLLALIQQETQAIRANTAEKLVASDAVKLNQDLAKESEGYAATIVSLGSLVDAYSQGGDAIADAEIDKQLEADRLKVAGLEDEYKRLFAVQGTSVDALAAVAIAIRNANEALDVHKAQLKNIRQFSIAETIAKDTDAFRAQLPAIRALGAAYLQSSEAIRQAELELKVAQFKNSTHGATSDDVEKFRANEKAKADAARESQLQQEAGALSLSRQVADEMSKYEDLSALLKQTGQSTLALDASHFDFQEKIIRQWDAAALKVGNFGDRTRALLNEITLDGKNFGESLFASFAKAVGGLEDQLADLVVTGKANFRDLLTSLEKDVAKASIQKLFSSLAGGLNNALGGAIPGLSGKRDGSTGSNSLFVTPVDGSGNVLGSLLGKGIGASSPAASDGSQTQAAAISGLFSSLTSKISSVFSSIVSTLGSIIGSIGRGVGGLFSGIFSLFGGGLAGGGDVSPGKFYMVGEKHPEFFSPKVAGVIAPRLQVESGGKSVTIHMNIHGVTNADSFRQSQTQIMAGIHQATAAAFGRTRS